VAPRATAKRRADRRKLTVESFYNHPLYIEALVEKIGVCLRAVSRTVRRIHLLFSAHGIPLSLVEKGDPYPKHIAETGSPGE
jgi:ferrochelatase